MIPKTNSRSRVSKKPWESKSYRDWVKANNYCLICYGAAHEAHHVRECLPRTMGVRVSDKWVVPLCLTHHNDLHQHSRTFWASHGIDPLAWCQASHSAWVLKALRRET